jgi:hypothetical protein
MLADGLTKPLLNTSFDKFVQQLGLIDVTDCLQANEPKLNVSLEDLGWFE